MLTSKQFLTHLEQRHRASQQPPTERDEAIYEAVRVRGQRQTDVAKAHDMSQGRVSQICCSVDSYLASHDAEDGTRLAVTTPRTRWILSRQRIEEILCAALRDAGRCEQGLATRRGGTDGAQTQAETQGQPQNQTVVREVRAAPSLDTAMRAMRMLWEFDKQQLPEPVDTTRHGHVEFIASSLECLRADAVREGRVVAEGTFQEDVGKWLRQLLGAEQEEGAEVGSRRAEVEVRETESASATPAVEIVAVREAGQPVELQPAEAANTANNFDVLLGGGEGSGSSQVDIVSAGQNATCVESAESRPAAGGAKMKENRGGIISGRPDKPARRPLHRLMTPLLERPIRLTRVIPKK